MLTCEDLGGQAAPPVASSRPLDVDGDELAQLRSMYELGLTSSPSPFARVDICPDFVKGACRWGSSCKLAHRHSPTGTNTPCGSGDSDTIEGNASIPNGVFDNSMHAQPAFAPSGYPAQFGCVESKNQPGNGVKPASSRTLCIDYTRGKCHRGTLCRYVHDASVMASGSAPQPGICKDALRGSCYRGSQCRFLHLNITPERGPHLAPAKRANGSGPQRIPFAPYQRGPGPRNQWQAPGPARPVDGRPPAVPAGYPPQALAMLDRLPLGDAAVAHALSTQMQAQDFAPYGPPAGAPPPGGEWRPPSTQHRVDLLAIARRQAEQQAWGPNGAPVPMEGWAPAGALPPQWGQWPAQPLPPPAQLHLPASIGGPQPERLDAGRGGSMTPPHSQTQLPATQTPVPPEMAQATASASAIHEELRRLMSLT
ncbi:unnamed protein product [Pedinophyceae sp. YPF-701]|nr:unnamed protein product [Pedinophyceae sp. YPF-701]